MIYNNLLNTSTITNNFSKTNAITSSLTFVIKEIKSHLNKYLEALKEGNTCESNNLLVLRNSQYANNFN